MGGLKYTLEELEHILSIGVDGLKDNRQLKGRMLQYGMYIFGEVGCSSCGNETTDLFNKLKKEGMENLKTKIERDFDFKDGFFGQMRFGSQTHLSNVNLTNELAIEFLSVNPERIKVFAKAPENWEKLVAEYKEKAAEEKTVVIDPPADTTPVVDEKHIVTQEDLDNNPDLVTQGIKVGDEIVLPGKEKAAEEKTVVVDPPAKKRNK